MQLTQLFKQCKFTEKLVYAGGCGMAQLAYYCATQSKRMSVINGREKGGALYKITKAVEPRMLHRLQKGYHVFLDNLTGDYYGYNDDVYEW